MHEDIKRFFLDGEVAYEYLSRTKETLERAIEDNMRSQGYVRVLDIDPQLSQEYNPEHEKFIVKISLYGVHVGDKECELAGMMYGKPVQKHIPTHRSKESSTSAELI